MEQVFTDYVRSLKPSGEPPEAEAFEEVCRILTRVLKSEIRKRGLWDMAESLEHLLEPPRTRGYLSNLWEFLRTWSVGAASSGSEGSGGAAAAGLAGDKLPSARKLARGLHIPRDRLSELFSTLRGLVEGCRAANSGKPAVNPGRQSQTSRTAER